MAHSSAARSRASTTANSAAPSSRSPKPTALFDGIWNAGRAASGLDEPRRPRHGAAAGLRGRRRVRERALRRDRRRAAANSTRRSSTPRSRTRRTARSFSPTSPTSVAGLRRRLDDGRLPRAGDRPHPRAGRQGQGDLRPFRRRRLGRRRRADPRGDRRPAHLRLRRPRPDAPGRGARRWSTLFRGHYNIPLVHVDARERFPRRARRRHRPGSRSARPSARLFIDVFERGGARSSAAPISSPRARSTPT